MPTHHSTPMRNKKRQRRGERRQPADAPRPRAPGFSERDLAFRLEAYGSSDPEGLWGYLSSQRALADYKP